jgi:iron complex outermembrane receptor protein
MSRFQPTALAVSLCFAAFQAAAQGAGSAAQPTDLAPTVVTGNPLGSSLFDLVPPVSAVGGRELSLRRQSSIGATLDGLPGVSSSYFGPNVGRPIIRGLDADRIRVMQNGLGVLDASGLSQDHALPLDPLIADRIEVVRGPAALLYGGSAVGGVVNVLDNRIPQEPIRGFGGRAEARAGGPASERNGALVLEGGNGLLALHADVFSRRSKDLRIPGFARSDRLRALDPLGDEPRDRLPNSSSDADGGAVGASLTGERGHVGLAYSGYDASYGVVAEPAVRIDMKNARWDGAGELREIGELIRSLRFKLGYTDYEHQELDDGVPATVFQNKGREGMIEATHGKLGPLTGVLGIQVSHFDFSALGDEAFVPQTENEARAFYLFEELPLGALKLNFGARYERVEVRSSGGGPDDPNTGAPRFGPAAERDFSPRSYAAGGVLSLAKDWALALNLSHTERAPTYYELFANGPHAATGLFEVGDPNLAKERSNSGDIQLRWRAGPHSASLGGFYTRFKNYVALFSSPNTRGADGELNPADGDGDGLADGSGEEILPESLVVAVPAEFYGLEAEGRVRLLEAAGTLDLSLRADSVRAKNRDSGEPLPRIPPIRLGAGLDYRLGGFAARLDVVHAAKQDRVTANELPTDSHTLVNAALSYRLRVQALDLEAFLRANNLFDQEARQHASFLKDIAPLPGRGFVVGLRGVF